MRAYLDNAATTRLHPDVAEAMELVSGLGNPSSLHSAGREARQLLEEARASVAGHLGVQPETITFTSGATESNNLAILGVVRAASTGRHIVTSAIEHSAGRGPLDRLRQDGYEVTEIGVDSTGRVDPAAVGRAVRPDTVLVSIMLANNEIGTIQPVPEIRESIGAIPFHCDAAQAGGKMSLDVATLGVDLLTLSGHKMHGPRGVGVLHRSAEVPLAPILHGGSHEHGLRPGTENVPGAVGLARALSIARRNQRRNLESFRTQRERLITALAEIPGAVFHGSRGHQLPTILSVSFAGTEGEALVLALDAEGVAVSAGSACDAQSVEPSHVLRALGLDDSVAGSSIRISLAADTSDEEIDRAIEIIPAVIRRLRDLRS